MIKKQILNYNSDVCFCAGCKSLLSYAKNFKMNM